MRISLSSFKMFQSLHCWSLLFFSTFPSIMDFYRDLGFHIRCPKYDNLSLIIGNLVRTEFTYLIIHVFVFFGCPFYLRSLLQLQIPKVPIHFVSSFFKVQLLLLQSVTKNTMICTILIFVRTDKFWHLISFLRLLWLLYQVLVCGSLSNTDFFFL